MAEVSACLIVRDEAEMLPACLESIASVVDEICIVDTGSSDGTLEIARQAGARVCEIEWENDFSAARNVSLQMATKPWIFVIDADERLDPSSAKTLRKIVNESDKTAFFVMREDQKQDGTSERLLVARLFRNDPRIRYFRPVHEDIMDSVCAIDDEVPDACGIRILHLGYLPEVMKGRDKLARNISILRQHYERCPDDLFCGYKLFISLGESEGTERHRLARTLVPLLMELEPGEGEQKPFLAALFQQLTRHLVFGGELVQARDLANKALEVCPQVPSILYNFADTLRRLGHFNEARAHLSFPPDHQASSLVRVETWKAVMDSWKEKRVALALDSGEEKFPDLGSGPHPLEVSCALLRWMIRNGAALHTLGEVDQLMAQFFNHDAVKLLAAELALSQGDRTTARLVLNEAGSDTDEGNLARAFVALIDGGVELSWTSRDVPTAALASVVLGEPTTAPLGMAEEPYQAWTLFWSRFRAEAA